MAENPKPIEKPVVLSEKYRHFPADNFGVRVSNHSAQITFGLEVADVNEREIICREAMAVMSLQSAKVLQLLLANALAVVEKRFGPVQLPPGKEDELKRRVASALIVEAPKP